MMANAWVEFGCRQCGTRDQRPAGQLLAIAHQNTDGQVTGGRVCWWCDGCQAPSSQELDVEWVRRIEFAGVPTAREPVPDPEAQPLVLSDVRRFEWLLSGCDVLAGVAIREGAR